MNLAAIWPPIPVVCPVAWPWERVSNLLIYRGWGTHNINTSSICAVNNGRKRHFKKERLNKLTLLSQPASLGKYRQHSEGQQNLASDLHRIRPFQSIYRDLV